MTLRIIGGILTGGTAGRMQGLPKGLLERTPGQTIIEYLLAEAAHVNLDPVLLLANEPEHYERFGMPVVQDLRRGQGPLGGIEAALSYAVNRRLADAVVFLPCDTPAIGRGEIARLRHSMELEPGGIKVAAVRCGAPGGSVAGGATGGHSGAPGGGAEGKAAGGDLKQHPVCCAVHCSMLPAIVGCLDRGERRLRHVWRLLGAATVEFDDDSVFLNLNTPEDLRVWRQRMECHDDNMRT